MKQTIFTGSACAIITPFDETRKVNYKRLRKLVEFQIENKTDAIVVCGTTGESSVLETKERRQIIKAVVKQVDGRIPVIAGTGSNSTSTAIKYSCMAEDLGADALLLVTPYYNKCSQNGLIEHYSSISDNVSLPMIVYNVPSRTGVDIKPETYSELCRIKNVVAAKEANGNISALAKTISLCADELDIYCGNDDQTTAFISMGAKGVISVMANILPQQTHDIAETALHGDIELSAATQLKYLKMCNSLFCDVNPIPVKQAMAELGIDSGICRLPLTHTNEKNRILISDTLLDYGLLM